MVYDIVTFVGINNYTHGWDKRIHEIFVNSTKYDAVTWIVSQKCIIPRKDKKVDNHFSSSLFMVNYYICFDIIHNLFRE